MGRPPIGKVAMTTAERVRRHRLKRAHRDVDPPDPNSAKITLLLRAEHAANLAWYDDDMPIDDDILQSMAYARDKWDALYSRSKLQRRGELPPASGGGQG